MEANHRWLEFLTEARELAESLRAGAGENGDKHIYSLPSEADTEDGTRVVADTITRAVGAAADTAAPVQ